MKIDWRIFSLVGAFIALVSVGSWAGSVNTRLDNHEKIIDTIPQIARDIATIKGFLEK